MQDVFKIQNFTDRWLKESARNLVAREAEILQKRAARQYRKARNPKSEDWQVTSSQRCAAYDAANARELLFSLIDRRL